jgi:hypothetical protein
LSSVKRSCACLGSLVEAKNKNIVVIVTLHYNNDESVAILATWDQCYKTIFVRDLFNFILS